jgi:hypothetical protein
MTQPWKKNKHRALSTIEVHASHPFFSGNGSLWIQNNKENPMIVIDLSNAATFNRDLARLDAELKKASAGNAFVDLAECASIAGLLEKCAKERIYPSKARRYEQQK